ncbi:hypothetical protein LEP1GSC058_4134 [Leptospira fainei serovar Hurstbridge str. BUT 6]|uniref:FAD-binding domain-containing protein n=1 Tax=Leptospira fainei serovar Hurstbridge str. BUT 6 TaxID=1193011 RepID=S3VC45_9LEPT|nr:FAD-dependent monooxygenase [Leptospira fainei]EPG74010.1 hypothetical protein LEP1GSC058_4134 [Leptospira fainei serovar Hurstbridge str. BUT 6]
MSVFTIPAIIKTDTISNAIVIGANPTGLFVSYLLGYLGIPTLILEDGKMEPENRQISLNQDELTVFEEIIIKNLNEKGDLNQSTSESFQYLKILYSNIKSKEVDNISRSVCNISQTTMEFILRKNISILKNVTFVTPTTYVHKSKSGRTIQLETEFGNSNFKILTNLLVICNEKETQTTDFLSLFLFIFEFINDYAQNKCKNEV